MLELTDRLADLLVRFVQDNLTEEEKVELYAWRVNNEDLFLQFTDPVNRERLLADYQQNKKITWQKLTVLELKLEGMEEGDEAPVRSISWMKYVAAASVILLVAVGGYFVFFNKVPKPVVAKVEEQGVRFKNDVSPANQSTILELSDGRKIYVDSASNGSLASQGKLKIVKKDGKVIYEFAKAPSSVSPEYNTMTTGKGNQQQLIFSDGSVVYLNAQSSIRFPATFTGNTREVEVGSGEFFFEVAKNKKMPFIVRHGDASVQVTGTKFNCNFYDDENADRTTLIEGSVNVKKGDNTLTLSPGQQAEVNKTGSIIKVEDPEVNDITAWVKGVFQFHHMPIETVMREAQRWYEIDVKYEGKISLGFNGKIPMDVPISKLLKILELTGGVKFKIEGKVITVMP